MTKTYSIAKSALNYALCIINCALLCACSPHRAHPDNLEDFSETLYTPTDASGFSITGKEGSQSSLITVSNPWQGADSVATHLPATRLPSPTKGRCSTGKPTASPSHHPPMWRCSTPSERPTA